MISLFDMQNIISITENYLDDEQKRTEFIINYLTWDANGVPMETKVSVCLTPLAQDEILAGLNRIRDKLIEHTF